MMPSQPDQRSLFAGLIGDGRRLLGLEGLLLFQCGLFALFLSVTGQFLPHDILFLGMNAGDLCSLHGCRIVHFMMHDRAAFGGTLAAIGLFYLWLAEFPLRHGEAWAWWLFVVSGAVGFASFLAYLGYGYLDFWHGLATLLLLPCHLLGLYCTRRLLKGDRGIATLFAGGLRGAALSRERIGQSCLLGSGIGATGAGLMICLLGMSAVFVPQDLAYMGVGIDELQSLNLRLVPLIAHDRAGFGGAVCCAGVLIAATAWRSPPSRSLGQLWFAAGLFGFIPAIGIHFAIGYDDALHLAPALGGAGIYLTGAILSSRSTFPSATAHWSEANGVQQCR